jgi:drug/metabolite transporter (DMT)-like permease
MTDAHWNDARWCVTVMRRAAPLTPARTRALSGHARPIGRRRRSALVTARQLAMLLALAALWGASFLFMRVAVPALGPIVLADARVAIAGVALLGYAVAIGARPALRARWRDYLLLGAVNAALPFSLLSAAELEIDASLAAVLNAMAPLCGALVGAVWLGQRVTTAAKAGLVLGVAGVALVVGLSPFTIDVAFMAAVLACLAAAFAYGVGANLVRVRFAGEPPLAMAIGQQVAAAVVLLPLVPIVPVRSAPDAVDVACVLTLALASTSVAYLLYFRLLAELGATGGMTVIFVVPVFGVLWGALFLGETIHLATIAGGAVILASVWLITRTPAPPPVHARTAEVMSSAR